MGRIASHQAASSGARKRVGSWPSLWANVLRSMSLGIWAWMSPPISQPIGLYCTVTPTVAFSTMKNTLLVATRLISNSLNMTFIYPSRGTVDKIQISWWCMMAVFGVWFCVARNWYFFWWLPGREGSHVCVRKTEGHQSSPSESSRLWIKMDKPFVNAALF